MARPKSEDKREAIMEAAVRVIAAQGLSAPTATIAREAGVANGTLFTYFETKAELWNALYVELKTEMAAASMAGLPAGKDAKTQLRSVWSNWVRWATERPENRRVLALLGTSDEITPQSHLASRVGMADIADLLKRSRANGPMQNESFGFVVALLNATADATIDYMIADPANAAKHSKAGFDALWRMIA